MLSNSSQLLLRNIADLSGTVLIAEPEADLLPMQLPLHIPATKLLCYSTNIAIFQQWQQAGIQSVTDISTLPEQTVDTVVIFYPKSKEQLAYSLGQLKTVIQNSTAVFVVGDNKGGIKSLANHAAKLGLQANKLDNAKHCLWFSLFGDWQKLADVQTTVFPLNINGTGLTVHSLPGVFNHGKLDTGTALLLENLSHIQSGKVLDFACGCGVIGAYLKKQHPDISLYSCDISTLATQSTALTLATNQLAGTTIAADGLPPEPLQFSHIVSNPPFHSGLKTDYSISQKFISQSVQYLTTGGSLTLVANSHLAYQELLVAAFGKVDILAKRQGFIVYRAIKR